MRTLATHQMGGDYNSIISHFRNAKHFQYDSMYSTSPVLYLDLSPTQVKLIHYLRGKG
jgi:hypothetical protein